MKMDTCSKILDEAIRTVQTHLKKSFIADQTMAAQVSSIVLCQANRAGARFLLASTLAKAFKPAIDIRKPFIQSYSPRNKTSAYPGRQYDERYVFPFITKHRLPCSSTTAFLTPAFRTKNIVLDMRQKLRGRPPELYQQILKILDSIQNDRISALVVLRESIRLLVIERNERRERLEQLKKGLQDQEGSLSLSSEDTVELIQQHLSLKNTSRLPVLIVAAAYQAASQFLGENVLNLQAHTAADKQTGSLGDVEITLLGDNKVVTTYEMKDKAVTRDDIDIAIQKIIDRSDLQNYIFVTTAAVDLNVREYASQQYKELGGVEIAILDCLGFLRHFLHLFHRLRTEFLNKYQQLVLSQPESAVNQPVKEAFLALRRAAQA